MVTVMSQGVKPGASRREGLAARRRCNAALTGRSDRRAGVDGVAAVVGELGNTAEPQPSQQQDPRACRPCNLQWQPRLAVDFAALVGGDRSLVDAGKQAKAEGQVVDR